MLIQVETRICHLIRENLIGRFEAQTISRRGSSHYDALTAKDLAAQLLFTQLNVTVSQLFEIAAT